jgi:ubiquinone/menaquinone biosynthesis C-methylase UbiE
VSSFGPYAGRNEDEFWASGRQIWQDLKATLSYCPAEDHIVVEIGCGVGRLTRAISPEVAKVFAFDISEEMLSLARRHPFNNVDFIRTNGASLQPVVRESADFVLGYCVFQHLPSFGVLREYVLEMQRVAKPKALIAFTLVPRTWRVMLLPLLRARRWTMEQVSQSGPRGMYRSEWVGIRPSASEVIRLLPGLRQTTLHGDKWLFYYRVKP